MTVKTMMKQSTVPIKKKRMTMPTRRMWDPFGDLQREFEGSWSMMPLLERMPLMRRRLWGPDGNGNWMPLPRGRRPPCYSLVGHAARSLHRRRREIACDG